MLIALCRPLAERDMFCDPASTREIASVLTVSEDAVKKHLVRLYNKFRDLRRIRKPPHAALPMPALEYRGDQYDLHQEVMQKSHAD